MTRDRRPYLLSLPALAAAGVLTAGFMSKSAAADPLLVRVAPDGTVVVTDRVDHPSLRTYRPDAFSGGDFNAWMRAQPAAAHAPRSVGPARPVPSAIAPLIADASDRHGVDPDLVSAVVAVESAFNPSAVSHAGAQGLMQLMPATARDLGVSNPFDPAENIDAGTRYLAGLLKAFDDESLALAAYNAGPGRVARLGRIPNIPETQAYVRAVRALKSAYALDSRAEGAP